jgi:hypothetical protein
MEFRGSRNFVFLPNSNMTAKRPAQESPSPDTTQNKRVKSPVYEDDTLSVSDTTMTIGTDTPDSPSPATLFERLTSIDNGITTIRVIEHRIGKTFTKDFLVRKAILTLS